MLTKAMDRIEDMYDLKKEDPNMVWLVSPPLGEGYEYPVMSLDMAIAKGKRFAAELEGILSEVYTQRFTAMQADSEEVCQDRRMRVRVTAIYNEMAEAAGRLVTRVERYSPPEGPKEYTPITSIDLKADDYGVLWQVADRLRSKVVSRRRVFGVKGQKGNAPYALLCLPDKIREVYCVDEEVFQKIGAGADLPKVFD